jgi:hypothetical protein
MGHVKKDQLELYLRRLPPGNLSHLKIIVGHIPFGFDLNFYDYQLDYVTFARDPIARMVSTYFYINQGHLSGVQRDYLNALLHRAMSMGGDVVYSNPMTRILSKSEALAPRDARDRFRPVPVTEFDFRTAQRHLETFSFVGLTERFDDSVRMLFSFLGREDFHSPTADNVTEVTLPMSSVHPHTLDLLRRLLSMDLELYGQAVETFNRRAAKNGLRAYEWRPDPLAFPAAFSSGDHSHLASAASAISDGLDGLWISHNIDAAHGEWIGVDFGQPTACDCVSVQLPPATGGGETTFHVEVAENDRFEGHSTLLGFALLSDGLLRSLPLPEGFQGRFWRLRCIQKPTQAPLEVAYLNFGPAPAERPPSPRDLGAVFRRKEAALAVLAYE